MWHATLIIVIYNCELNPVRPHKKGKRVL